jgi:phosphoribosyl-ATP pyrophosphohydrolase
VSQLTDLEARVHAFREKIPFFIEGGRASALRGLGEELGELAEAAINGDDEEFYKEAADVVFVAVGMLAAEGVSLNEYLLLKLERAEANVEKIIEKQRARRRGET